VQITDVTLDTVDGPMRLYSCVPEGGAPRAVIVIHEAGGMIDYIEDVTRRFADVGFQAVAPALFHRAGGGTAAYGEFEKVAQLFEGLTDAGIVIDVGAAVAHLHEQGFADESIGIVGFCWGGRVSFLASLELALGAAVGFYGGGIVSPRSEVCRRWSSGRTSSRPHGSGSSATSMPRSRSRTWRRCARA